MNSDIVGILRERGLKKDAAKEAAEAIGEHVAHQLAAGETVRLEGIGTLSVKDTAARQARNPRTGETVEVPAGRKIAFKISKLLKERLTAAAPAPRQKNSGRVSAQKSSARTANPGSTPA